MACAGVPGKDWRRLGVRHHVRTLALGMMNWAWMGQSFVYPCSLGRCAGVQVIAKVTDAWKMEDEVAMMQTEVLAYGEHHHHAV